MIPPSADSDSRQIDYFGGLLQGGDGIPAVHGRFPAGLEDNSAVGLPMHRDDQWLVEPDVSAVPLGPARPIASASTAIAWSYYGDRCANYLFGTRAILPYKFVFVVFVFLGMVLEKFQTVYDFSDATTGLMVLCNLPAVLRGLDYVDMTLDEAVSEFVTDPQLKGIFNQLTQKRPYPD